MKGVTPTLPNNLKDNISANFFPSNFIRETAMSKINGFLKCFL